MKNILKYSLLLLVSSPALQCMHISPCSSPSRCESPCTTPRTPEDNANDFRSSTSQTSLNLSYEKALRNAVPVAIAYHQKQFQGANTRESFIELCKKALESDRLFGKSSANTSCDRFVVEARKADGKPTKEEIEEKVKAYLPCCAKKILVEFLADENGDWQETQNNVINYLTSHPQSRPNSALLLELPASPRDGAGESLDTLPESSPREFTSTPPKGVWQAIAQRDTTQARRQHKRGKSRKKYPLMRKRPTQ